MDYVHFMIFMENDLFVLFLDNRFFVLLLDDVHFMLFMENMFLRCSMHMLLNKLVCIDFCFVWLITFFILIVIMIFIRILQILHVMLNM
jgi:hypothetical protein